RTGSAGRPRCGRPAHAAHWTHSRYASAYCGSFAGDRDSRYGSPDKAHPFGTPGMPITLTSSRPSPHRWAGTAYSISPSPRQPDLVIPSGSGRPGVIASRHDGAAGEVDTVGAIVTPGAPAEDAWPPSRPHPAARAAHPLTTSTPRAILITRLITASMRWLSRPGVRLRSVTDTVGSSRRASRRAGFAAARLTTICRIFTQNRS